MNSKQLVSQFGFEVEEEPKSIYPFSPVYKVNDCIIKRTQSPLAQAIHLVQYEEFLQSQGIPVVTPVNLKDSNPLEIDDQCYICYPFINGRSYVGERKEIEQAGALLGRIHFYSSSTNSRQLDEYKVFDFYHHEIDEHMEKISRFVTKYNVGINLEWVKEKLYEAVRNQEELKHSPLPWLETPHDYKANNLVFNESPTLIDPDNAMFIPRVFDVALALLLFHNESDTGPDRVFTINEWKAFLQGYKQHHTFLENEIALWEKAVLHVFMDEVMWLMAEEEDWQSPSQRLLFKSLIELLSKIEEYGLS